MTSYDSTERKVLLLFIDLNNFKSINDNYGHSAGDYVLKAVGKALRISLRQRDWVARWGGDEFLLMLSSNERNNVPKLIERIHEQLKSTQITEQGDTFVDVDFSTGAAYLKAGMTAEQLIEQADANMYVAKKEPNKNYVSEYL